METANPKWAADMAAEIINVVDEKERLIMLNPDPKERIRLMRELINLLRNFKVTEK